MRIIFDQSRIDVLALAVDEALETAAGAGDFQIAKVSREAYRM